MIVGTTFAAINLRICTAAEVPDERLPKLPRSYERRIRRIEGRDPRTVYHWSTTERPSRQLSKMLNAMMASLLPNVRKLRRLVSEGARVELILSVMTQSDFGGFDLSLADMRAIAKLQLPVGVHLVANVSDLRP